MNPTWTNWRKANYRFFDEKLGHLDKAKNLVDLGSGAEQFAQIFHQFNYTPVDFEKFSENTIIADLTQTFPIANSSADIVTLSNTVEHIPNTQHFFNECYRILKTEGLIIGTVPFLLGVHQAPYDFNRYTPFQLKNLLESSGFKDVKVVSLGSQVDVYNTIELKVFEELRKQNKTLILELVRSIRRLEMRLIRWLFTSPAGEKVTEGYGFTGIK